MNLVWTVGERTAKSLGSCSFSEQFILFNCSEGHKAAQVRAGKAPNLQNNDYNSEGDIQVWTNLRHTFLLNFTDN